MQALMMITALAWPIIGGALVGLVTGIMRKRGLFGTIINTVVPGLVGFALTMAFVQFGSKLLPNELSLPAILALPVVGGFIGLWLKGRVIPA